MSTKVWSFRITSNDETEIHGKTYRVRIAKQAILAHINGSVRNIKSKPEIEVKLAVVEKVDAQLFKDSIEAILNDGKKDVDKLTFYELYESNEDKEYVRFEVIREDELIEMVWALQGAGAIFQNATQHLVIRDLMKSRGLLSALRIEVGFIDRRAKDMINNIEQFDDSKFNFVEKYCLEKALAEPAWAEDDFMQLTNDLFYKISRSDKEKEFKVLLKEDKLKEVNEIKAYASQYLERIEQIIKYLDGEIDKYKNPK